MGAMKAGPVRSDAVSGIRNPDHKILYVDLRFAWQLVHDVHAGTAQNVEPEEYLRAMDAIRRAGELVKKL